ncbi:hypothetical protein [Luteimonas deserti]|uniref:DUF1449 family protein n=1 Tax=Luteimonas deserti TaxID=2752306 RepID=A0A7Z0QS84_9GAMM|nr:hypothetical protein [Luteimonas deserti]NYZ62523.1 hypothetical protein [Luteimonas deserti]
MTEFTGTALGYPTLVYSIVLAFCTIYWLLAATGLVDLDLEGLDVGELDHASGLSGMLARIGLDRLPLMLVVTLVAFIGWFLTYFVHLFLLVQAAGWLRWLIGTGVALAAFVAAVFIASALLRPVRRWLLLRRTPAQQSLLGRVGVVRTASVSDRAGLADVDDGGAGLILQVRADGGVALQRGDRVVLVAFDAAAHAWRVLPETQYRTL